MESVKQYTISQIQKADFVQAAKGIKFIFLKPMQFRSKINWKDIIETTKDDLRSFYEVLGQAPFNKKLIVMTLVVVFF